LTTLYKVGDALLAERIAVRARRIDKGPVVQGSSRHRIQTAKLRESAYCEFERSFSTKLGTTFEVVECTQCGISSKETEAGELPDDSELSAEAELEGEEQ
jgi:hypothetical protein